MNSITSFRNYIPRVLQGDFEAISKIRSLIFATIALFLVNILTSLLNASFSFEDMIEYNNRMKYPLTLGGIIMAVIVFPVFEELTFRLFLGAKRFYTRISLSLLIGTFSTYFIYFNLHKTGYNHIFWFFILTISISILIAFLISIRWFQNPPLLSSFHNLVEHNFRLVYFLSALCFAAFHIMFHNLFIDITVVVSVIMFISYFLTGLVLGYLRITSGIRYSILLHAFMNSLVFLKEFI